MFATAMIFAAPNVEVSIYSTCKRISQKLLRNVLTFLELVYTGLGVANYKVIRCNMEELVLKGPESPQDRRVINSYPSKVFIMISNAHISDIVVVVVVFDGRVAERSLDGRHVIRKEA